MFYPLNEYFARQVCLSILHPSQKKGFVQSTNVANECCYICFRDEKYRLGITHQPLGLTHGVQMRKWEKWIRKNRNATKLGSFSI